MLMNRILGAFMFRKGVYKEVAEDSAFTQDAWMIVIIIQVLSGFGRMSNALSSDGFLKWLIAGILTAAVGIGAFAVMAYLIPVIAKALFKTEPTFEQMVRVLGLASVWQAIGVIGILGALPFLSCVLAPISLLAGLAGLAAILVGVKEATGMDWAGTIVMVLVAGVVWLIGAAIVGVIVGGLAIGTALITQ